MSSATAPDLTPGADAHGDDSHGNGHNPNLAHHFETPAQQYASAKLGMWVFLGTEILMFGGLFCAYAVYRHNHPEVFEFAHKALNPVLGGINTAVLITSSLTMAMAVRFAQLGRRTPLMVCLACTLLGGLGFMMIKTVEYRTKWEHNLFPGKYNVYNAEYKGQASPPNDLMLLEHEVEQTEGKGIAPTPAVEPAEGGPPNPAPPAAANTPAAIAMAGAATAPATAPAEHAMFAYADPLLGTPDEPKIKPNFADPQGLSAAVKVEMPHLTRAEMPKLDQQRINTFFSVYFLMTGLHGLHVLIGMALISWVLLRSSRNEFGPRYFTPVDLVGLYWHLVDLIWIFLFPLLYLIH